MLRTRWLLSAALLFGHVYGQATLSDVAPVSTLLTPGKVTVEILKIALPDDALALEARVREAVKGRPGWYLELWEQTPEGGIIPYDARLGITEPEFQRLVTARRTVTVTGCSTITLLTIKEVPGQVYLRGGPGLDGLNGVSLRPWPGGTYAVNTRVGTAGDQRAWTTTADDPLGVRSGYTWSLGARREDQSNYQLAALHLSRDQTGRLIVGYVLEERRDGQEVRNVNVVVRSANCQP
ncbi:hypothetical protein GCM10010840_20780 [Deinococcus aerolatus]|uniref:Uncharacterized protein n=1 Tax=Deinococcus aerolatus TaxID=522487 RepID=A0ABQ2GAF7_9DEIO|nr:hypothetical protein [Deinococcus aerolatus]GGL82869.1 hypothetical protein GCM10010840_20780 [Deinococcus aerolatus]